MFKTGVIGDEISQDFERVATVTKELGLESIEIRSTWNKPPQDLGSDDIVRIKRILKNNGLKVCAIASPFFKCDIDSDDEYKQHLKILERCIRLADELGTRIIRGFTFWKKEGLDRYWEKMVDRFIQPVKVVGLEGIILGIENEHSCFLGTGNEVKTLLGRLNSKNVKAIWDPCNEVFANGGYNPFPEGYDAIKDQMVHMHLKDAKKNENGEVECVAVGKGVIDYKGHFKRLLDDGYDGCISLETHWRIKKGLSTELLNRPAGNAFSEQGEEATRVCVKNWFDIIREIR